MGRGIVIGGKKWLEDWGTKRKKQTPEEAEEARQSKAEYQKNYMPGYCAAHRADIRRNHRKCVPPLSELIPGYVPLNAAKPSPPPPCGGDCENCPWDACKYPNWDDDHEDEYIYPDGTRCSREKRRRDKRDYEAKLKERRKDDPELDTKVKADQVRYARKHRAKVKFVKAGGTPEGFEALWAEAEGDRDVFIGLCAEAGIKIKWKRKGDRKQWT